jgi:type I restriction enzyme S subunit
MRWDKLAIGDFCRTGSGGTPSRKKASRYFGGNIPWVKSGELREGVITETEETITQLAVIESSAKFIPKGALLVAMYGATIGRVAKLGIDATSNQAVCHILPDESLADMQYMFHVLQAQVPHWLGKGVGGAQPNISQEIIKNTVIPLPPLEEQRRIAAILDKGESVRTLFAKREKTFLAVEESLFAALNEGDNGGLAGRTYLLSDVFWFQEGPGVRNWQFTASGVKLLNVGNITTDGRVDLQRSDRHISEDEAYGRYSHFLVDQGDLLMPSSGIPIDEDGLLRTRSAFASCTHLPLCMNTSTIRFKPKMTGASLIFLQGWLQSCEFRAQITKLVTGSAQKNFVPSHLKQLRITLPESSAQLKFEERLAKIRMLRVSLSPSTDGIEGLISSLAHRAFTRGVLE